MKLESFEPEKIKQIETIVGMVMIVQENRIA